MNSLHAILVAFALTLFSGLSTGIGGAVVYFAKQTNARFLSVSLGFSAGVMIYVSMIELFQEALHKISAVYGAKTGMLYTALAFFFGMLLITVIDKIIPCDENPHELQCAVKPQGKSRGGLKRTGLMTAIAIALHNFPEGMASFISGLQSARVALPIVFAIAIHNIPEGIAVSMPVYYATGSRKIALRYSLLSGLAEPLGAIVAYLILLPFLNDLVYGVLFAVVAGIMVFISLDELLPGAEIYGEHHLSMYGMVAGMIVMALSLWLFA